jgi:dipeptidyl aminopeptidase/acylaminoacyl peptidase
MRLQGYAAACAALFFASLPLYAAGAGAGVDVAAFVKKDSFETIKISPTGEYYAASVPFEDSTALVVLRRSDNKIVSTFNAGKNTHVAGFLWVNPERVLISMAEKFGSLDKPQLTGELYAIDTHGGKSDILVGWRVHGAGPGTKIQPKKVEAVAAFLIDALPDDDKNVLITVWPNARDPFTRAERMDVDTGRRIPVARAPVRNARFFADNSGIVRFALGVDVGNSVKLYYRDGEGAEWKIINDELANNRVEVPLGFSADDKTAYLQVEQPQGADAIVAMDIATGTRKEMLRDDNTDPSRIIYQAGTSIPVGAWYMDGKPRTAFFDVSSPEARLYRSLEAAFPGEAPFITSTTADGKLALVQVSSDRNPGDFFVFDTVAKKADHLISRRTWFDPAKMAEMRPVSLAARDGLALHGYLTLPSGSTGKNLPLVVMPHGGPFYVFDEWGFENDSQLLAAAGYAVLQLNFRGSSNHGRAFSQAGAREWGGKMQDDLTDATRWAVSQGFADANRICIYGASYGGYAALMGVAKEPALYKCAAGYVGVYDLPVMQGETTRSSRRLGNWSMEWVGKPEKLASVSPNRIADRIKVPVFLAAGGEDKVAPIEHSKMMERALAKAGVPVETLYYPNEGHGFYVEANRKEFYTRLLAFLARNIGGATATGATGASAAK